MATSGSIDFNLTRDQIIHAAARKVQAVRAGQTMSDQTLQDFAQALNAMVKRWQARGIHVWTVQEATLFPQASQLKYQLGNSSSDHATDSYVETAIATAASSGASSVDVDSDDNISDGDYIGVVVDDGTYHWTTVNGTPSGDTITLTDVLDDSAAVDNRVFAYTTKINRPLKIPDGRRYDPAGDIDTPITGLARLDYQALPNKTQTGTINNYFYDAQLAAGYLYLWQPLAAAGDLFNFTYHRAIEDFDAAGNNPDLPQEWIDTLIFNLAVVMAPEYEVPQNQMAGPYGIGTLADRYLDDMMGWDREHESVRFGVEMMG